MKATKIAIFHSESGSPMSTAEKARKQISEPLNWCRPLEPSYYVCSHGG